MTMTGSFLEFRQKLLDYGFKPDNPAVWGVMEWSYILELSQDTSLQAWEDDGKFLLQIHGEGYEDVVTLYRGGDWRKFIPVIPKLIAVLRELIR